MNDPTPPEANDTVVQLTKDLLDSSTIRKNLSQEILIITIDKAKLCLIEHQKMLMAQRDWIAPATTLLALLASLVAADFKDFLNVKAEVWQALFMILSLGCGIQLAIALERTYRYRGKGEVDRVLQKLAESSAVSEKAEVEKPSYDLTGVWKGVMRFRDQSVYNCSLHLTQQGTKVSGTMVVSYGPRHSLRIVEESVVGEVKRERVSFHGVAYSFLQQGASSAYSLDSVSAEVVSEGTEIIGEARDSKNKGGTVSFKKQTLV